MKILLLTLLLVLPLAPSSAHELRAGDLVIVHPTVDDAEKGQADAKGSMEIRNEGKSSDELLSISAEFAERSVFEPSAPVVIAPGGRCRRL